MQFSENTSSPTTVPEITFRVVILSIILTLILAMANAYLALKIGMLTSASIPAAVLSMSILRFFKKASILENNLVQTAASAGEAVAGGIVYTIPALIIIHYWMHFDYWDNFLIAFIGGGLGVFFSIPLRKILVHDKSLKFPEGVAVAEVLKVQEKSSAKEMILGGMIGALLEFFQTGLKVLASQWQGAITIKKSLFSLGLGFSSTMIGAGFLIGFEMVLSIFIGALINGLVILPILSLYYPDYLLVPSAIDAMHHLSSEKGCYVGIGAMLFAGIIAFFALIKPLAKGFKKALMPLLKHQKIKNSLKAQTEKDLPLTINLVAILAFSILAFFFFKAIFPLSKMGFSASQGLFILISALIYILIIGFLFAAITGYFSGMVGVSASPGSSIIIAGMLIVASLLLYAMKFFLAAELTEHQLHMAEAITIIIGAVVTGIAAIANDNMQDLKVGQLVGATPWKQQIMLLLGVLVSAMIIPIVMQLLFNVYGIASVLPRAGMNPSLSLPAPPAALMAAITEGVFKHNLPTDLLFLGGGLTLLLVAINQILRYKKQKPLSILGVAIGIYLPSSSSIPLFIGGIMAVFIKRIIASKNLNNGKGRYHKGVLIACGLVAGAALMDVLLAIPFSLLGSPDALSIADKIPNQLSLVLTFMGTMLLFFWIKKVVCQDD